MIRNVIRFIVLQNNKSFLYPSFLDIQVLSIFSSYNYFVIILVKLKQCLEIIQLKKGRKSEKELHHYRFQEFILKTIKTYNESNVKIYRWCM